MIGRNVLILLLTAAALGSSLAAAQDDADHDARLVEDLADQDVGTQMRTCDATEEDASDALPAVVETERRDRASHSHAQHVEIDPEEGLLAIALGSSQGEDIPFADVRSFETTRDTSLESDHQTSLDRNDVFSTLALGLSSDAGSLQALACVASQAISVQKSQTQSRDLDLDATAVLLAIAMPGNVTLDEVASKNEGHEVDIERSQSVDVDRQDTFLAIALGAGGQGTAPAVSPDEDGEMMPTG